MKYLIKIKPYAENEKGHVIKDFNEEEWDLIIELYERLIRNFKENYNDIKFKDLSHDKKFITMIFTKKKKLTEEDLGNYIEILGGYNIENTVFFEEENYSIKAEIICDENKKKNKLNFLDKFNKLTEDFAPELIDN